VPADSAEVEKDARPPLRETLASTVEPSRNLTVPVGVPLRAVTVAVSVTV
jgi:hypothetical protein